MLFSCYLFFFGWVFSRFSLCHQYMIPPPLSDYIGFSLFFFSALQADISPGVCQTISFYCSSLLGRHISHWRGERGGGGGIRSNTGKLYILLRDFVWVCSCFLDGTMGFFLISVVGFKAGFYLPYYAFGNYFFLGRVERNGTFCRVCCSLESPVSFFFSFVSFLVCFGFLRFAVVLQMLTGWWYTWGGFPFWLDRQTGMISRWGSFLLAL